MNYFNIATRSSKTNLRKTGKKSEVSGVETGKKPEVSGVEVLGFHENNDQK